MLPPVGFLSSFCFLFIKYDYLYVLMLFGDCPELYRTYNSGKVNVRHATISPKTYNSLSCFGNFAVFA